MSFKLKSRVIEKLTPKHVREARSAPDIPGERVKKKSRLQWVIDLLEHGDFCRADFAYCACKETGKRHRVNGNHTSTVLLQCIENTAEMPPFPDDIMVQVEEWECDTITDLINVFDTFDNARSTRSSDDRLHNFIGQHPDLYSMPEECVKAAVRGVNKDREFKKNPDSPHFSARDVGLLLEDNDVRRYCAWIADFAGSTYNGWKQVGINAAMYDSWVDDEEVASVVWEEVMSESNADPASQSRLFTNTLRTYLARKGKKPDFFYRKCQKFFRSQANVLS